MIKLEMAEGQDRNVFNTLKRVIRDISKLDNQQLAALHFEAFHEARVRSNSVIEENKDD